MLLAAVILTAWAVPAHAQAIGSIFGKVTDPSGAILPGVTVTVTGPSLQAPLVAATSASGTYQFPSVPVGTFTVTFELASFKKAVRPNIVITNGFNAPVDQKLELGQMSEEVTISASAPVVDTKKTTTGGVFTAEVLEKIPTARDPQQIVNMAPGVQLNGVNVGGSASGQQLGFAVRGSNANVQWNLEGGSITDLSSNSSPSYYNFDSLDQIQVVTGGGDVSVQSGGVAINLVTKSGSNVFKGTLNGTFENDRMQAQNVTQALFNAGAGGFLSGNPIKKIDVYTAEYGGPILRNKFWFWGSYGVQDINVGIINFFDAGGGQFCSDLVAAQKARTLSSLVTYDKLSSVQKCLSNDRTLIKDIDWKLNYQINAANKIQWLFTSDNKYRNHRNASATNALEVTAQQTSDAPWKLPLPTHSITHTFIASDKLLFNNQFTYVGGGFFLDYQDVPPQGNCLQTRYIPGADTSAAYQTGTRASANCAWNIQALNNSTTGLNSRAQTNVYQTVRHTWEAKTDGTYFLTHKLGGDHSLKFGLGWRKAPILSFTHYSGGANVVVECVGNSGSNLAGCGDGNYAPAGSAAGVVARQATLRRDQLRNNSWWTYNGYIQDGYAAGRWRVNGGLRYDWQQSKYLGGCVAPNVVRPDLLPSQCETATSSDSITGKKIQPFGNWSPRVSGTYDVFGNGKTSVHSSFSYYYDTKITLANSLAGLFTATQLTWGPNTSTGLCTGASCWTDFNLDGLVQANELSGTPGVSSTRFVNGVLVPAGNIVDPSAKIGRSREAIVGVQHELIANLAVGVDFIYRKYDHGTTTYSIGYQPGGPLGSLSAIYTGPLTYVDPNTGLSAPYFVVCDGCTRPTGLGQITVTNPNWQIYRGVEITATKRYSNRWQMQSGVTFQTNPQHFPVDSGTYINPTGRTFADGGQPGGTANPNLRYVVKANGSYTFPWDISGSANFNWQDGPVRITTINGPGQVYGGIVNGVASTISYSTLTLEPQGATRLKPTKLLDLSAQKSFRFRGGRDRIKLILDAFNVLNANTPENQGNTGINAYASNNRSSLGYTQPTSIIPPRVFRVGTQIAF